MTTNNFTIDVNKIIEHYNLDKDKVAEALFPNNRYKKIALDRILTGKAVIDANQINALSNMIGILPQELYMISDWKGTFENKCIVLKQNEYTAKINHNGAFLSLYKNDDLIYQEINALNISLDNLINHLDNLIKKLQNNGTI